MAQIDATPCEVTLQRFRIGARVWRTYKHVEGQEKARVLGFDHVTNEYAITFEFSGNEVMWVKDAELAERAE